MKNLFFASAALLFCGIAEARESAPEISPATIDISAPEYVYCEIIANHLPVLNGDGVLFDFGQQSEIWAYNWLKNAEGQKLLFNSGIEALNYMVVRGWEFVQAYPSGEKSATAAAPHLASDTPTTATTTHQTPEQSAPKIQITRGSVAQATRQTGDR